MKSCFSALICSMFRPMACWASLWSRYPGSGFHGLCLWSPAGAPVWCVHPPLYPSPYRASSDLLPVRAYECRGKRSPNPTPLGMTDIVLNRLHFGFRCACIQRRFRFEVSVNQLIFNLDFQVVNRLLTFRDHFCKAALSGYGSSHKSGRSYQTDYQFYGRCRVCLRRSALWHMAIDTGHVVLP